MKRRHYLVSLIIDIFTYLTLTLITMNFLTLIISGIYSLSGVYLQDDDFIVLLFPYIEIAIYLFYIYFYFIFVPFKNKQGTLGDVFVNIKLTRIDKDMTKGFLFKRLLIAFIGNLLFLSTFIYMFFKKSNRQTLHDNLLHSKYEHVRVMKQPKTANKKANKTKKKTKKG